METKFKVGDRVKVIGNIGSCHLFDVGTEAEIVQIGNDLLHRCKRETGETKHQWLKEEELSLIESAPLSETAIHLQWIHNRLVNVYMENPDADFMIKLREIIKAQLSYE